MQSLALDVNVVSEEGARAEMRDEDDDLLRAAEELGIDLSGVRAGNGAEAEVDAAGPVEIDALADAGDESVEVQEVIEPPEVELTDEIDADVEIDAEAPAESERPVETEASAET